MDFNNQVLIVDVANIRDQAPETMKTRKHEGRDVPLSSLEYLDSALDALEYQVPSGTVLKIADFALKYNFPDDEKIEFERRTKLEPTDPQFIYLLPYQSKKPEKWSERLRRKLKDNPDFIEADAIIISLALELDAYVVSGDSYSDEKFDDQMESLRDRLFVHHFNPETNSWVFAKSIEYYAEHREKRDSWDRINSLTTIAQELGDSRKFEMQSDLIIRDFAFNTLIEEFWEHKQGRITVDQDRHLTSNTFKNLVIDFSLRRQEEETVARRLGTNGAPAPVASDNRELVPVGAPLEPIKEIRAEQVALPMPTYYASAVHAILRHKDERIALMGKLVQDDSDFYIEWVLSDKRIKILATAAIGLPRMGELVRITGRVQRDDANVYLEVESRDTVVTIDLADIVRERVDKVRRNQPKLERGYWFLPSMRWGGRPVPPSGPVVDSGFVSRPIPISLPKPLPKIPKTPLITQSDVNPIRSWRSVEADWFIDPISSEKDGAQLFEPVMTTVNSSGRIEFVEPVIENHRATKVGRSLTVLIAIALGFIAAISLYFYTKYGFAMAPLMPGGGGGFRLIYK